MSHNDDLDLDLDLDEDLDIDTPDGHDEEDQDEDVEIIKLSKKDYDRLVKQNEKLKANKVKHITKHKTQGSELEKTVKELQDKLSARETQELEQQAKSLYEDADIEEVKALVEKGLTVKQAINALYSEEISKKTRPSVVVWRNPSVAKDDYPRWFEHRDKRTQARWKEKNWK